MGNSLGVGVRLNGFVGVSCIFTVGEGCDASKLPENMWVIALAHERQSISATNIIKPPMQP
ncbi:hypothetical protein KSD_43360 [Ktedonobacter sp. SOSP1-85]|nr:hypothetical protein KSD_43360 [Ktedonobacter sp. SOSP1-85]